MKDDGTGMVTELKESMELTPIEEVSQVTLFINVLSLYTFSTLL